MNMHVTGSLKYNNSKNMPINIGKFYVVEKKVLFLKPFFSHRKRLIAIRNAFSEIVTYTFSRLKNPISFVRWFQQNKFIRLMKIVNFSLSLSLCRTFFKRYRCFDSCFHLVWQHSKRKKGEKWHFLWLCVVLCMSSIEVLNVTSYWK